MKKLLSFAAVLSAVLLLAFSCSEPDPVRDAMEAYAKANIDNPDSYKFNYMGIEKEYTYFNDLAQYMQGLEKLKAQAKDKAPYEAELEKAHELVKELGTQVACREYSLYFWCMGGQSGTLKLERVVLARYDADGKLMAMTMDPGSLPTYPALQMLKDQGRL